MSIIKFDYVTQPKIWGQEEWIISAHENGMSYIKNGEFKGQSLAEFFQNNKQLLGIEEDAKEFPLLVKIIEAKDDLSVQVHPDNEYAKKYENSLGKAECWYILSDEKSDIVIGQKAKTKEELKEAIDNNTIMDKLNIFPIKKGDFFYIPAGCVHAIRSNTKLLEVQQSSDITYRLYDYNRPDDSGNLRELHVDKSLDVIDYSFKDNNKIEVEEVNDNKIEILTNNEYFEVKKISIKSEYEIKNNPKYILGINLDQELEIEGEKIKPYEGFMVLKDSHCKIKGTGEFILSTSK